MEDKIVIETILGEKLIGVEVEPTEALFQQLAKQHFPVTKEMISAGIWLLRDKHVSFIADSEIRLKRPATIFDNEEKLGKKES